MHSSDSALFIVRHSSGKVANRISRTESNGKAETLRGASRPLEIAPYRCVLIVPVWVHTYRPFMLNAWSEGVGRRSGSRFNHLAKAPRPAEERTAPRSPR